MVGWSCISTFYLLDTVRP